MGVSWYIGVSLAILSFGPAQKLNFLKTLPVALKNASTNNV